MSSRKIQTAVVMTLVASAIAATGALAQQGGGGGVPWKTASASGDRDAYTTDAFATLANLQSGQFKMVWKNTLAGGARQMNGLTQPNVAGNNAITYLGFKSWSYYGGNNQVTQTDYAIGKSGTTRALGAAVGAGTLACPGGITSLTQPISLPAVLAPPAAPAAAAGAAGGRGGAAGGGGRGAAATGPTPLPPRVTDLQTTMRQAPQLPAFVPPNYATNGDVTQIIWAIDSTGMAYPLNWQNLQDVIKPVKFTPAGANIIGTLAIGAVGGGGGGRGGGGGGGGGGFAGGGAPAGAAAGAAPAAPPPPPPGAALARTLLAATTNSCGGAANGLWKLPYPTSDAGPVTSWSSQGANLAGDIGPALGSVSATDFLAFVATSDGAGPNVNSVIGIDPISMTMKGQFKASAPFTSAPLTFQLGGKTVVAATNKDGKLYLLDGSNLGGAPLATSAVITGGQGDYTPGALASWADSTGQRWIAVPEAGPVSGVTAGNGAVTNGALVAFKVTNSGSTYSLSPGWVSRDLTSPSAPTVVGGVVFVASTGQANSGATAAARIKASKPGVLYALDATTGKDVWNSGAAITGPSSKAGPAVGSAMVMVSSLSGTMYGFGQEQIR